MRGIRSLLAIIFLLSSIHVAAQDTSRSLAVIVNPAVVQESLSKTALSQILLGEEQFSKFMLNHLS